MEPRGSHCRVVAGNGKEVRGGTARTFSAAPRKSGDQVHASSSEFFGRGLEYVQLVKASTLYRDLLNQHVPHRRRKERPPAAAS